MKIRPSELLKGKTLEELQEICLGELLGISKKRLLSILNANKCPTDTESSESDSDIEKVEGIALHPILKNSRAI